MRAATSIRHAWGEATGEDGRGSAATVSVSIFTHHHRDFVARVGQSLGLAWAHCLFAMSSIDNSLTYIRCSGVHREDRAQCSVSLRGVSAEGGLTRGTAGKGRSCSRARRTGTPSTASRGRGRELARALVYRTAATSSLGNYCWNNIAGYNSAGWDRNYGCVSI